MSAAPVDEQRREGQIDVAGQAEHHRGTPKAATAANIRVPDLRSIG